MNKGLNQQIRQIPQIDRLLNDPVLSDLRERYPALITRFARKATEEVRAEILKGETFHNVGKAVRKRVLLKLDDFLKPNLRRVINATGVILHTGLGRAPLSQSAKDNLTIIAEGFCNLEYDLKTGKRGQRLSLVDDLLCGLTGAESSAVVNNNAAAVLLSLNSLAYRKEVIVSRGELVEIGGAFRIPEVIKKSGAKLVEIGTTNKTRLNDYEKAISLKTGAILKAHTSNYKVMGFTEEVDIRELTALGKTNNIPVIADLGGGVLVDLREYGLPYEPVAREYIETGVDLVTFSGDKVLGGPQAGIIIGKKPAVDKCRKNQLMRALRCDKLILSALEATLRTYFSPKTLLKENLTLKLLTSSADAVLKKAQVFYDWLIAQNFPEIGSAEIRPSFAQTGSGALPLEKLPSYAVYIKTMNSVETFARKLRMGEIPIIGTIQNEELVLDFKTILEEDIDKMKKSLYNVL
jgi:L-seryl-tRNA(Ser) seleniumtransferase